MPGPRPLPTHLKILRGNPSKESNAKLRLDPQPEIPNEVPSPPAWLMDFAKQEWTRVAGELLRVGCLTVIDYSALAICCQAFGHFRTAEEVLARMRAEDPVDQAITIMSLGGRPVLNPVLQAANTAAANYIRFAAEFGLTAAARSRVAAVRVPTKSKFGNLLAGGPDAS